MSDDWQVGDLALGVKCDAACHHGPEDKDWGVGQMHRVTRVLPPLYEGGPCGLMVAGSIGDWCECGFRKIRPDAHEPCEAEFVTLLKRAKQPSKVGA